MTVFAKLQYVMIAIVALAAAAYHVVEVRHARTEAYQSGQLNERILWQERQRRAELDAEADRAAAQQKIKDIETSYWQRQTGYADQITDLRKALDDEKSDDACTPIISRRMRDKLDAIGRETPARDDTGGAEDGVR